MRETRSGVMSLFLKLIVTVVLWMAFFGALLFVPAGTLDWWRGWILLGALAFFTVFSSISLLPARADLIKERLKPPIQQGQPLVDKIVLSLFLLMFFGLLVFISLDVFHLRLLRAPSVPVSALGLALVFAGWWIAYLGVRENAFAATVVKHPEEQIVVDTGVYGVIRHPLYAGGSLLLLGMPLWLGSYAGAVAALVPIGTLIVRAVLEERFLTRELNGYEAYTRRVRYRLIPCVW